MSTPLDILKKYWQHRTFKPNQEAIIRSVLSNKDTFVLLPTGGGKSACYQIPALLKDGICLVISPLISLIENQVNDLKSKGIKAMGITGNMNVNALSDLFDNCTYGTYSFLYLSPERLQSEYVLERIKRLKISFIAIDEAHCISQWGNDFRPAYKKINKLRELLPETAFIALTATATKEVQDDIISSLNLSHPQIFTASFKRDNIALEVLELENKLQHIQKVIKKQDDAVIIYVSNRKSTNTISTFLKQHDISALPFHGGLTHTEKKDHLHKWMSGRFQVMVATTAFGMGIDKANVCMVIHYHISESIESYYQEVGRAGRNGKKSKAILIKNNSDLALVKKQYLDILPTKESLYQVYNKLNSYFQIPYGEGTYEVRNFNFSEFCLQYKLNPLKTFHIIQFLERQSILFLEKQYQQRIELTLHINNQQLIRYLDNYDKLGLLVKSILRTYSGTMDQKISIDPHIMFKKTGIPVTEIIRLLGLLEKDQIASLILHNTDTSLTFLVPREDRYTLNPLLKYLVQQNEIKKRNIRNMLSYVNDSTTCKQRYILNYFNEKPDRDCGICSICIKQKKTEIITSQEELKKQILDLLLHGALASYEIIDQFDLDKNYILDTLLLMLEFDDVCINDKNQITIP